MRKYLFAFQTRGTKKAGHPNRMSCFYGAGNEARTRYLHLGKVALYQMSYAREARMILAKTGPVVKPLREKIRKNLKTGWAAGKKRRSAGCFPYFQGKVRQKTTEKQTNLCVRTRISSRKKVRLCGALLRELLIPQKCAFGQQGRPLPDSNAARFWKTAPRAFGKRRTRRPKSKPPPLDCPNLYGQHKKALCRKY